MPAPDVFAQAFKTPPEPVSQKEYVIAGILTTIYGLEELSNFHDISCLWLLHPRGSQREAMASIAYGAIRQWAQQGHASHKKQGLICVSFDQRNHGVRQAAKLANEDWRSGNPRHAQDMFSIFQGTAADTSLLIDYLPAYIFPQDEHTITSHLVLGVSLGGHAAWQCVLHDSRITSAVVIIGCSDYVRLMHHRAEKSKLESWHAKESKGSKFLGSKDFPKALQEAVDKWDPASLLMAEMIRPGDQDYERQPTDEEKQKLMPLMRDHLQGKKIFNIAGGADKLVPYTCSVPFLTWLKNAIRPGGWYADQGIMLKDKLYEGAGHEVTSEMVEDALAFLMERLREDRTAVPKI